MSNVTPVVPQFLLFCLDFRGARRARFLQRLGKGLEDAVIFTARNPPDRLRDPTHIPTGWVPGFLSAEKKSDRAMGLNTHRHVVE